MNAGPGLVFLLVLISLCIPYSSFQSLNVSLQFVHIKLPGGKVVAETWRVEMTLISFHKQFERGQRQRLGANTVPLLFQSLRRAFILEISPICLSGAHC